MRVCRRKQKEEVMKNRIKAARKSTPKRYGTPPWPLDIPESVVEASQALSIVMPPSALKALASLTEEGVLGFHPVVVAATDFIQQNWLESADSPLEIDCRENYGANSQDEMAFRVVSFLWEMLNYPHNRDIDRRRVID
jgi:hypothetical protein